MLDCVVIEIHQHLCCANVYFKFKDNHNANSYHLYVDDDQIILKADVCKLKIVVSDFLQLLPETFFSFVLDETNVSFRVGFVDNYDEDDDEDEEAAETADQSAMGPEVLNISERIEQASLHCSKCNYLLVFTQHYEKIRELPSISEDSIDFFWCHTTTSYKDLLVPREQDLFYGYQFIVINLRILDGRINVHEDHLYCKRCLQYLGKMVYSNRAAKLWSDNIRFGMYSEVIPIFNLKEAMKIEDILNNVLEKTWSPDREPLLLNRHFVKVLFKTTLPNRNTEYLLLHILDRNLRILRTEGEQPENQEEGIKLYRKKAFKVLYRSIPEPFNNGPEPLTSFALLSYWKKNANIFNMEISEFQFRNLTEELKKHTSIFPTIFRNDTDGFRLSYIFY